MEWNDRKKKRLAVAGGVALCAALMALIGFRFMAAPEEGKEIRTTESTVGGTAVAKPDGVDLKVEKLEPGMAGTGRENEEKAWEESIPAGETGNARIPRTDNPAQKLQADVPRPEAVPEEGLRDPARRPDGEPVEGPPAAVEHEGAGEPEKTPAPEGEPQAGDTSGGQIYIPGFGWVEDKGGGAVGETAPDMYENGNKIGSMG